MVTRRGLGGRRMEGGAGPALSPSWREGQMSDSECRCEVKQVRERVREVKRVRERVSGVCGSEERRREAGSKCRCGWILAKVRCGLLPKYRGLNGKFRIRDLRRSIE